MATVYNKMFERSLIVLIILFAVLSFINPQFFPLVFIIPAILFLVRMIQDIRKKNDKQASRNLTTTIIFVIGIAISIRLVNL